MNTIKITQKKRKEILSHVKNYLKNHKEYLQDDEVFLLFTKEELEEFVDSLLKDYYPETMKSGFVSRALDSLKLSCKEKIPFLFVWNEPDSHARNDGWGAYHLFSADFLSLDRKGIAVYESEDFYH